MRSSNERGGAAGALGRIAACAAVLLAASGGARAEDAPPERVEDPQKLVALRLPQGSKSVAFGEEDANLLATWELDLVAEKEGTEGVVYAWQRPAFTRAVLAGSMGYGCRWGEQDPESVRVAPAEWRENRLDRPRDMLYSVRIVEAHGQVFFAVVQVTIVSYDTLRPRIDAVLDSFEVLAAPKPAPLPAGFKSKTTKGLEVISDAKKKDLDRISREWGEAVERWEELLPGKREIALPPRLYACADDAAYTALFTAKGGPPAFAFYDWDMRAVVVRMSQARDEDFVPAVHRAAGEQLCHYHFGGRAPVWVVQGLRMWLAEGVRANGHFDQVDGKAIDLARKSAEERRPHFSNVLAMTEIPRGQRNELDRELLAWHFYFSYGPGSKTHGERYRDCLAALRESGDVREVAKAWEGVDHDAIAEDFLAWVRRWREGKYE